MKNFTNNFKQFTSRLSARWLIMALMLLLGTSSAWATIDVYPGETIIIDVSSHGWFNNDNCYPKLYCGNTVIGQASGYESDKKYEITLTITSVVNGTLHVSRCNSNGEYNKQYIDDRSSSKINTFKITGDGNGKWNTTQSSTNIYYLRGLGDFDKWNNIKNPYTIYLNKGDYEFKIYDSNDNWYGNEGTMTRDNCSGWTMETDKNNCKIKADVAGNYTFTFNSATKKLSVTYPELPCYTTSDVDPGTISSDATNNTICGSGSVELKLTNTTSKDDLTRTIQWQKYIGSEWSDISNAKATTYTETISATTKYRAKVTWIKSECTTLTEYASESGFTITVNALPSAPTFTSNEATVCSGVAFNLNEKFTRNTGEAGNLTWYKSSDDSQVTNPASVTITEATSYYAKATNNNCTSDKSLDCIVNVDANPTLELESTPTVCPNVQIDLDDYATYNTGTLTWYSNQERTTVITDGLVTPTERTTYYAKVTNGTCNPVENEFTVDVYGIADEMPAYTQTKATKCKDEEVNSDGIITLKNPMGGVTYTLDDAEGESNEWTGLSAGTHKLSATVDACSSLTKEWDVNVEVENITPTATVSITGESSFCEGDNTELTCEVETTGEVTAYQWYNGDNLIQGATESTYTAKAAGSYKVVVTVENKGCEDTFNATKEVSVKNKPTTPEFNPDFTSICVGGSTTLASGYSWYTDLNASALANLTVSPQTETTYYAIKEENGCTSDAGTFTVKVNPLPTITSISASNDKPVLFEDVELTAAGENIDKVEWTVNKGTITKDATDPKKAVLTYDQTGTVTVTATATSAAGCKSAAETKTVKFSEETCEPTTITVPASYIEIYCKYKDAPTQHDMKVDIWKESEGQGTESYQSCSKTVDGYAYWKFNITDDATYCIRISNKDINYKSGSMCTLTRGHKYYFDIPGGWSGWKGGPDESKTKDITETQDGPPAVTAPAVKTVSATSVEGSGVVNFTGQIIKTGCAATSNIYYGYQFKKENEEWPTNGIQASNTPEAGKLIPCTNASATALNYQFSTDVEGLEDGNYHFRAYIINGYNFTNGNYDQGVYYGLEKLVTVSTVKTPISNVAINYSDIKGTIIDDPNPMCKGATAYVKLSYVGSKYSDIKWLVEGVETNLVTDEGDGVWSYEIQGDGSLSVELKNDANTDPAWPYSNKLSFTMKKEPADPYISIDPASGIICEGSTATIKVENPSIDCSYKLVEEEEDPEVGFTQYESGDLKYTVQNVAKYYVVAQHNACRDNEYTSNQVAINQIISTSATISIEPNDPKTTPWEPVTITVNPQEGYVYELTYTDNNLDEVEGVRIKQNGDSYTYYIPRPDSWGTGDSDSDPDPNRAPINYVIQAQLKVDGEESTCKLNAATATIQLNDEDNEDCHQ